VSKLSVDEFIEMANQRMLSDAAKPEKPADAHSDPMRKITKEMLDKGFRLKLAADGPVYEIIKLKKDSVEVAKVEDIENDAVDKKDPAIYMAMNVTEFLEKVNAANDKLDAESTKAPEVQSQEEPIKETIKKGTMNLSCFISEYDRDRLARDLASLQQEIDDKEEQKKAYTSQIAGEIKELESRRSVLKSKVNTGKEFKDVAVETTYLWLENRKKVVRLDTYETISDTAIPSSEHQKSFLG